MLIFAFATLRTLLQDIFLECLISMSVPVRSVDSLRGVPIGTVDSTIHGGGGGGDAGSAQKHRLRASTDLYAAAHGSKAHRRSPERVGRYGDTGEC